jgi:hypothetical protein
MPADITLFNMLRDAELAALDKEALFKEIQRSYEMEAAVEAYRDRIGDFLTKQHR